MKGYKGMDANMGDLINRTEAISNLRKWLNFPDYNKGERNIIACAIAMLEEMPSAERKGEWVKSHVPESVLAECSVCGYDCGAYSMNFCPNCGADMRGEKDANN